MQKQRGRLSKLAANNQAFKHELGLTADLQSEQYKGKRFTYDKKNLIYFKRTDSQARHLPTVTQQNSTVSLPATRKRHDTIPKMFLQLECEK